MGPATGPAPILSIRAPRRDNLPVDPTEGARASTAGQGPGPGQWGRGATAAVCRCQWGSRGALRVQAGPNADPATARKLPFGKRTSYLQASSRDPTFVSSCHRRASSAILTWNGAVSYLLHFDLSPDRDIAVHGLSNRRMHGTPQLRLHEHVSDSYGNGLYRHRQLGMLAVRFGTGKCDRPLSITSFVKVNCHSDHCN